MERASHLQMQCNFLDFGARPGWPGTFGWDETVHPEASSRGSLRRELGRADRRDRKGSDGALFCSRSFSLHWGAVSARREEEGRVWLPDGGEARISQ